MGRDTRYAAALLLAVIFFCFFMYSWAGISPGFRPAHAVEPSPSQARIMAPSLASPGVVETSPSPSPILPSNDIRGLIPGFPVNINSASLDDLMLLPGIGPATARRIIEKRASLGGFTSVAQLTEVKWIGKVKLDKIRNLVTVD